MYNHIRVSGGLFVSLSSALSLPGMYFIDADKWLWYGIPLLLLCLILSVGIHWDLRRRRGSHRWNISKFHVKIKYENGGGSKVRVTRSLEMYPNRRGVRDARIGVSSSPEQGYIDLEEEDRDAQWNPSPVPGRSPFGREPPDCNVSKEWFRKERGFYLVIRPQGSEPFPYPEFSGLFRPKKYPMEYFKLDIEGTVIYRNSFTEDEEYLEFKFPYPALINSLNFELILPKKWSDCPDVNWFRINADEFKKTPMAERDSDETTRRFSAGADKTKLREGEILRIDWRKGELGRTTMCPSG